MKVSELEGAELDYWVAKADGFSPVIIQGKCLIPDSDCAPEPFRPSADWDCAGFIIEREKITISPTHGRWKRSDWMATERPRNDEFYPAVTFGQLPLIAAMRCFVASKFGEEVTADCPSEPSSASPSTTPQP